MIIKTNFNSKFLIAISQYKSIIKKLQHLIGILSYNQRNMNLEEMVRFLTNIQLTYNQLLSGYVGVFYAIKKCQYKRMCFDCAQVTGHLQKLIKETNYTFKNDLSEIQLSNRTINYLASKMHNYTKGHHLKNNYHEIGKMKNLNKSIVQSINQLNPTNQIFNGSETHQFNLNEILKINKKLQKQLDKLIRLDKKKLKKQKNVRKMKHNSQN